MKKNTGQKWSLKWAPKWPVPVSGRNWLIGWSRPSRRCIKAAWLLQPVINARHGLHFNIPDQSVAPNFRRGGCEVQWIHWIGQQSSNPSLRSDDLLSHYAQDWQWWDFKRSEWTFYNREHLAEENKTRKIMQTCALACLQRWLDFQSLSDHNMEEERRKRGKLETSVGVMV